MLLMKKNQCYKGFLQESFKVLAFYCNREKNRTVNEKEALLKIEEIKMKEELIKYFHIET